MTARWTFLHGTSWAGLAAGPLCWALSTQLSYSFVHWECQHGSNLLLPAIAAALALISLAGAVSSWTAWRRHDETDLHLPEQDGHPRYLLAGVGVGAGILFCLVIALQGAAALILDPCLR
jgi:hypothetical protein